VNEPTIRRVHDVDLIVEPWSWRFALDRQADIAAHFEARRAHARNGIWNGRVLLMHRCGFDDGVLRGACFETDFADYLAWRDWDCPDAGIVNCFAMGALRGSDGAFLLGVMGPHTANAGRVYFPAGTPDPDDIVAGRLDLAGSVLRELEEETGLGPTDVSPGEGWHAVATGPRLAMMRILRIGQPAEFVRTRILDHLARSPQPELADIRIVRNPSDLDAAMPNFVTAFLHEMWR
jgi:8-oxo-dGTP pyrophosphatase MutT (NUDIX family)